VDSWLSSALLGVRRDCATGAESAGVCVSDYASGLKIPARCPTCHLHRSSRSHPSSAGDTDGREGGKRGRGCRGEPFTKTICTLFSPQLPPLVATGSISTTCSLFCSLPHARCAMRLLSLRSPHLSHRQRSLNGLHHPLWILVLAALVSPV